MNPKPQDPALVVVLVFGLLMLGTAAAFSGTDRSGSRSPKTAAAEASLASLLRSLLPPAHGQQGSNDWTRAEGHPIDWDDDGPSPSNSVNGLSTRRGSAALSFGRAGRSGTWRIELRGDRSALRSVRISSEEPYENYPDIPACLRTGRIILSAYKCSKEAGSPDGHVVHSVAAPGKRPAWLKEGWYCNPMGKKAGWCSIELELLYFKEDADAIECRAGN